MKCLKISGDCNEKAPFVGAFVTPSGFKPGSHFSPLIEP